MDNVGLGLFCYLYRNTILDLNSGGSNSGPLVQVILGVVIAVLLLIMIIIVILLYVWKRRRAAAGDGRFLTLLSIQDDFL